MFVENSKSSKLAKFYLRWINLINGKKWLKIRINKVLIDIDFIVKLFMKKLLFIKAEIIHNSTQWIRLMECLFLLLFL